MTEGQAGRAVDRIISTLSAWEEAETDLYRDSVQAGIREHWKRAILEEAGKGEGCPAETGTRAGSAGSASSASPGC
jgi:hypothetical protein